ncbi:TPA: hypothetical protein ACGOVD_001855, partial [Streptococcus suis]
AHGILLFLGCQAFFDNVDKKLSNNFGLWYNSSEKGIERQLNPSRTVLKTGRMKITVNLLVHSVKVS